MNENTRRGWCMNPHCRLARWPSVTYGRFSSERVVVHSGARRDCQSLDRSLHIFRKAVEARLLYASPNFTSLTPFFTFVIVPGNSSDRDRRFQPFRERANPSMRASSSRRVASKASSTHEARTTMNLKRLPERIIITYTAVLEGLCYSLRRTDTHVIDLWDR